MVPNGSPESSDCGGMQWIREVDFGFRCRGVSGGRLELIPWVEQPSGGLRFGIYALIECLRVCGRGLCVMGEADTPPAFGVLYHQLILILFTIILF
jgi:hypothetical protein